MLRFEYNGTKGIITDDGLFKFYPQDYAKINYPEVKISEDLLELEIKNETNVKKYLVNSYKDLLLVLAKEQEKGTNRVYFNYLVDDYLFIAYRELSFAKKPLVCYKIENNEIRDLIKLLINSDKSSILVASRNNAYTWAGHTDALDVMFTTAMLNAKHETIFDVRHKKKKNGKIRTYYAPHEEIKKSLRKLNIDLQNIYDKKNESFQVAYKKGKNVLTNATIHKDKKYVFNIDLKDFYPSCKRELVAKYVKFLFNGAPYQDKVVNKFLDCILINDGLFIGSPVSGCLANTVLNKPVAYIKNICTKYGMEFSVYADDMSFSSDKFITKEFVENIFKYAFAYYGLNSYFKLNEDKSIGYSGCNRKITGVSINGENQTTPSRKYYRTIRVMVDHLAKGDTSINIQKLQGKIAYGIMIDESGKIYRYLKKFENTVREYKLCSKERMKELENKFGGIA